VVLEKVCRHAKRCGEDVGLFLCFRKRRSLGAFPLSRALVCDNDRAATEERLLAGLVKDPVAELVGDGEALSAGPLARLVRVAPDLLFADEEKAREALPLGERRAPGSLRHVVDLADLQLDLFSAFGTEEVVREETRKIERTVERARDTAGFAGLALFAIFPPICEETLFRGIALRGFAKEFGPARALLYTSLLFAGMHGTAVQLLLMTFLGLYFGVLSWLTGSVWPAVFAHAINNAAVLILQVGWGARAQNFRPGALLLALSALVFGGVLALMALDRRSRALAAPS
jgi:hypothetical protein